jgi:hypothetical protein
MIKASTRKREPPFGTWNANTPRAGGGSKVFEHGALNSLLWPIACSAITGRLHRTVTTPTPDRDH